MFGTSIVGTQEVSDAAIIYAGIVIAEWLDNNENGTTDNKVADALHMNKAVLMMVKDDAQYEELMDALVEATA